MVNKLQVDSRLREFIDNEILQRLDLDRESFWQNFSQLLADFTPRNVSLLQHRDELQSRIDDWHRSAREQNQAHDGAAYKNLLQQIGYLNADCPDFKITTSNVDPEIALQAGPQLVVPVKNARFALNATNARWGSLYDALYGTDAIPETGGAERVGAYNPKRGEKVIARAREFLDASCPLTQVSHSQVTAYTVRDGRLVCQTKGGETTLADETQFKGYRGEPQNPTAVLLENNRLHIEIQLDRHAEVGATDVAGVNDVVLEAAITTIQDCEDSVAAVDAEDKLEVYRNWLGLITGELEEKLVKGGTEITRRLRNDRDYLAPDGSEFSLPGRSLMLVRNVGHLMRNPAILDADGEEIFEGIMDAVITGAIGALDVLGKTALSNSRTGSVYIVKPKMHGPDEV
ncbi:MAG: malate synthase G, partial [Pseudomonadales bacterium]|nr:malate synthase G [Pseudomonadales bacterium]